MSEISPGASPDQIPDEFPGHERDSGTEVDDQPLGVPEDPDEVGTDQPGLPDVEPPSAG